jgi:hypothetical protein
MNYSKPIQRPIQKSRSIFELRPTHPVFPCVRPTRYNTLHHLHHIPAVCRILQALTLTNSAEASNFLVILLMVAPALCITGIHVVPFHHPTLIRATALNVNGNNMRDVTVMNKSAAIHPGMEILSRIPLDTVHATWTNSSAPAMRVVPSMLMAMVDLWVY